MAKTLDQHYGHLSDGVAAWGPLVQVRHGVLDIGVYATAFLIKRPTLLRFLKRRARQRAHFERSASAQGSRTVLVLQYETRSLPESA